MRKAEWKISMTRACVLLYFVLLTPSFASALSLEQWKQKQQQHDLRLKQQPQPQQISQRIVQVQPVIVQDLSSVSQSQQVLGEYFKLDINQATAEEIVAKLDGIGHKKAQAIIQYRQQNGFFKKADDLLQVKGIGQKTLAKNRDKIKIKR